MELVLNVDVADYEFLCGFYKGSGRMAKNIEREFKIITNNKRRYGIKNNEIVDEHTRVYDYLVRVLKEKKSITMTKIISGVKTDKKIRSECLNRLEAENIIIITKQKTATKPITVISYVE